MAPERTEDDWIEARLETLWPAHVAGFTGLLTVLREQFDGDLDAMLILTAVSVGTEMEDWRAALRGEESRPRRRTTTNGLSLAHATGIPRETVRRKLARLSARGWVERDARGQIGRAHV